MEYAVWYICLVDAKIDDTGWFLCGQLKDSSPWIIPLGKAVFTIGRLEGNDLIINSSAVSRKHARITVEADGLYIADLESKNGIGINGSLRRGRTLIREGDIIRIGESEFTLTRRGPHRNEVQKTLARESDATRVSFSEMHGLSERESEVLYHLIKGQDLKFIGERLCISSGTVKNHVLKIYRKTGCHSRIALAARYADVTESPGSR